MKTRIIGYAARAVGNELEPFSYDPPELKDDEIRVSISHCGICYSDIHAIDDYYGITTFPFVPGHEIVGQVSEVGSSVTGFSRGDRVGMGWQGRSCMKCEWCLKGEEQLCREVAKNGVWNPHGGFSSSITVDSRFAYHLPAAIASEHAAVLLCAGVTVYSSLRKYVAGVRRKVGIVGIGGLGHMALQFAHAMGCDVTAISSSPEKESEARAFGADHFLAADDRAGMRQRELSFDMILYTSHGSADWSRLSLMLKNNAKLVMVGFSTVPVSFKPQELVVHELSFTGSFLGNHEAMRATLAFAQDHGIKPRVELMPMSQVNEAIRRVKDGKARYRIVLFN